MVLFARSFSIFILKIFFNFFKFLILKALTNFFLNYLIFFFNDETIKMLFIYISTINFFALLIYIYKSNFDETKSNLISFLLYVKYKLWATYLKSYKLYNNLKYSLCFTLIKKNVFI